MENTFKKKVSSKEASITLLVSAFNICPPILDFEVINQDIIITSKKFTPMFNLINDGVDISIYYDKLLAKLNKLHQLNILHMDISEDNIIVDLENNEPYFIDFGLSIFIDSKVKFKKCNLEDILTAEVNFLDFTFERSNLYVDIIYDFKSSLKIEIDE